MKLIKCDRFKNHFYDSEKFNSCPHCAQLGVGDSSAEPKRNGFFSKHKTTTEQPEPFPALQPDDKTVMLTQRLEENPFTNDSDNVDITDNADIAGLSVSGSVNDLKTMALYGLDEDITPVVGWLVVFDGEEKGRSFELKSGKNTIGRSGGNMPDICLDGDRTISRGTQAIVVFDPKNVKFLLQTTDGSSLVYLNEELLMTFSEIQAYDHITIGETELVFVPFCTKNVHW